MKRKTKNILYKLAFDMPVRYTDITTFFIRKEDYDRKTKMNKKGGFITAFLDTMIFKDGKAQPVNNFRTLKKAYKRGKMPAAWLRSIYRPKPITENYQPISTPEAPQHTAQFSRVGFLILVAVSVVSISLIVLAIW